MLLASVTRRPRCSSARTPAWMRGISEGDEIASTTTWPLRWSARGGMSIRADNSKRGAEEAARGESPKAPRVVVVCGRKCQKRDWGVGSRESENDPPEDGDPGLRHPTPDTRIKTCGVDL